MSDIEIEIDGKPLKAKPNSMIIQVADEAGIYIPRFCYHKHLSVAANCRMCLVEVEKAPKPAPACATPVMPGMKVFTRSPKALAAQRAVMEFLLINHPLDCPICDQGGECELQDLSMGYGTADSYYTFGKRSVKDENLGPLIASDMTRCIQCTRCVRFGDEIAGLRELGAVGRGEDMEIGTYVQKSITSEVSGNVIDVCPVGALTSKPYRFTARAWELNQLPSIAPHDCLGSNIHVHCRFGQVKRVVPRENDAINQTWLSDRDRFSYQGIYHPDRIAKPQVCIDGQWQETDWQTALEVATNKLQQLINQHGSENVGALASPNATLEELYLLQKIMRTLGSNNIDYRLRQTDFSDEENFYPISEAFIERLEECDSILLIGSHIQKEQPLLGLRVRKASLKGAKVTVINMVDYSFHFKLAEKIIVAPHELTSKLAAIAKVLDPESCKHLDVPITESERTIAEQLQAGTKTAILVGALALNHPDAGSIKKLVRFIASKCNGQFALLTEGANAAGAWLVGALPHRNIMNIHPLAHERLNNHSCANANKTISDADPHFSQITHSEKSDEQNLSAKIENTSLNAAAMLQNPRKAYLLLNVEPELDCANPIAAVNALKQAECVIALSLFKNPILEQYAHVILPIGTFAETAGTFVNVEGKWQGFQGVATPFAETRPAWKVLRVLGNFLHLNHFEYTDVEAVTAEIKSLLTQNSVKKDHQIKNKFNDNSLSSENKINDVNILDIQMNKNKLISNKTVYRIGEIPMYSVDNLVRHATALQETQAIVEGDVSIARLHPLTASQLNIKEKDIVIFKQHENKVHLPIMFDERIPEHAVLIAGGIPATSGLSELFGEIEVEH